MKKYVLLLFLILILTLPSAEAKTVQYRTDKAISDPVYYGNIINIIKDHNGYNYSIQSDGLYKLDYNGNITYFGFGISGNVNNIPFYKLSTDYTWSSSLDNLPEGYSVLMNTNNWKTVFNFTPIDTKITNTFKNTLASPITNGKFYYIFTINSGDTVEYNKTKYTIPSNPNIHISNNSGNLNNNVPKIIINENLLFDFRDIVDNGFNITDVYLVPASNLGFTSSYNIVAIGFTRGSGIVPSGATVTIDPTITQNISPSLDTYVHSQYATNYGSLTYTHIYSGGATAKTLTYFALDLPANTTSIINSTIFMYSVGGGSNNPLNIKYATNSWTESTTWSSRPSEGSIVNTIIINGDGWESSLITVAVRSWWDGSVANYGIYIDNPTSDSASIDPESREGAHPPYITVWYTTNDPPTVPVLTSHANYHSAGSTTASWTASTDPDGDSISYRVKVGTSSGADNVLNETVTGTSSSSFSISPTNTYYWSVYAFDINGGSSGWATESSFAFINSIPTMPNISSPLNNSRQYNNTINSTWNTSSDGDSDTLTYDSWLSNQSNFGYTVNRTNFSNNWTGNIATTDGETYYFRIEACDSYSCIWSPTIQFTENNAPITDNISLSPRNVTTTGNLTVSLNYSDVDGDSITKHYLWYKNGVLQGAWNDTTYRNYSGNYTLGDQIYVQGFVSDGYENSSELQSNTIAVGAGNGAPMLQGITLNPNSKKYNKTITVSTLSNITDAESSLVQLQAYRLYANGSKNYFGNSSWVAPPDNASVNIIIPWSDGTTHTIYAQANDSGSMLGLNSLTSTEVLVTFTSNISSPIVNSSSVNPSSVTTGDNVIITITADGIGANISTANVTITRPDYTSATLNLTCTYTSGDISTCTRSYTANSGVGTYSIDSFNLVDDSGNTATPLSTLTFEATTASTSSNGGDGGSTTIIIQEKDNETAATPLLRLKNITTGATQPELEEIARCLTDSLFLENKCTRYSYGVVVEPMNWWVFTGAFFASFGIVVGRGLYHDKQREWYTEPLLYGTTTTLILVILVTVGFNMYILNYFAGSPKYALTFLSTALWGSIVALVWDEYYYGKKTYKILRQA